jgi:hypothetical protein
VPTIAELLAHGRLERIAPDRAESLALIEHARVHLRSAEAILDTDVPGAYQLAYDAARKAVTADMAASGYRVRSDRPGAHAAVIAYAQEALEGDAQPESLSRLDRMRRLRNRTEYGGITLARAQTRSDLEHAREIVRAVGERLREHGAATSA